MRALYGEKNARRSVADTFGATHQSNRNQSADRIADECQLQRLGIGIEHDLLQDLREAFDLQPLIQGLPPSSELFHCCSLFRSQSVPRLTAELRPDKLLDRMYG